MTIDMWLIISVICAYIIKGLCGFANTLVFSTIMGFHANNIQITPVELVVGYPSNFIMLIKERKALKFKVWFPLTCLVLLGSIPGIFLLKVGDITLIKVLFGVVVVGIGLEMLLRERKKEATKTSKVVLLFIGILSGVLCGLFGIGALLAAYISRTTTDNSSFRGNLCAVFCIENTLRIIVYAATGIINWQICKTAICLIPFMLLGLGIGISATRAIDEKIVKKVVCVMLILSGISLVILNLKI